jgi:hypothetical protein
MCTRNATPQVSKATLVTSAVARFCTRASIALNNRLDASRAARRSRRSKPNFVRDQQHTTCTGTHPPGRRPVGHGGGWTLDQPGTGGVADPITHRARGAAPGFDRLPLAHAVQFVVSGLTAVV